MSVFVDGSTMMCVSSGDESNIIISSFSSFSSFSLFFFSCEKL